MTELADAHPARFKAYRDRAVFDLLLQLPAGFAPGEVWDLGCGDGEYTALLARRFPRALVHGLDRRAAPLAQARARPGAIDWVEGRIEAFAPAVSPHLIFSNSVLHFLPDHKVLLPCLAGRLAPGGVLAAQMRLGAGEPDHLTLRQLAGEGPWASALKAIDSPAPPLDLEAYYRLLAPVCRQVDLWRTRYVLPLRAQDRVIDWIAGIGLLPYLEALPDPELREAFTQAASVALEGLYPRDADGGLLLRVERTFIVAVR